MTPLDEFTLKGLIALGACCDGDAATADAICAELKTKSRFLSSREPDLEFGLIWKLSWAESFDLVKGLTIAENRRISSYCGSVSLVKYAFRHIEARDRVAAMEVAAWVVDHSTNDYIPFEMRKIRHAFEQIKRTAASWEECRRQLDAWEFEEFTRQRSVAARQDAYKQFAADEKQRVLRAVNRRCQAERHHVQEARGLARRNLIRALENATMKERLEHIAWDDVHPLTYFPPQFAEVSADDFGSLAVPTRDRLITKLRERRKGAWRRLYVKIAGTDASGISP